MSNSSIIRSRYTKNEVISVMQEVASLMGSRKQKAHFSTEASKIKLQTAFLEERFAGLKEKLHKLEKNIESTEITAKAPSELLLKLRSARKTLTNEYIRFQEIEKKSRRQVKDTNKNTINQLTQENQEIESHSIPFAQRQLDLIKNKNDELKRKKESHFLSMAKLHADFISVRNIAADELKQSMAEQQSLMKQDHDREQTFNELSKKEGILTIENGDLDELIKLKQEEKLALESELEKLTNTKKRIDSLDDPKEYIEDLSMTLEENKLSLLAKNEALETVKHINAEINELNKKIQDGINDYVAVMTEFEDVLANI